VCQNTLTGRRNSVPAVSGAVRPVLTWRDLKHRTLKPASSAHRPVRCRIANLSAHESGGHRTRPVLHKERPVTPRRAHIDRALGLYAAGFFSSSSNLRSCPSPSSPPPCPRAASFIRSVDLGALGVLPAQDPLQFPPPSFSICADPNLAGI